jgi:hypothetical protein
MSAELNVQLRLQTEQIRADASKAASIVDEQLNKVKPKEGGQLGSKLFDGWGKSLLKFGQDSTKSMNWFDAAVRRATIANNRYSASLNEFKKYGLKDLPKMFGAQSPSAPAFMQAAGFFKKQPMQGPDLSGALQRKETERLANLPMQGPDLSGRLRRKEAADEQEQANKQAMAASRTNIAMRARQQAQATSFQGRMTSLAMPMFNPSSPWANFIAGRQVHGAMTSSYGQEFLSGRQGGMMGQAGGALGRMSGGNAMIATGILVAGATAIGLAFKALKKSIEQLISGIKSAIENASKIYSKALTSGLGIKMTVKKGMLSSIIGVSEDEVLMFGAAISYLNPKIEWAAKVMEETAVPLTQIGWEFKVLGENMMALFALIATQASPVILALVENINEMITAFSDVGSISDVIEVLKMAMAVLVGIAGGVVVAFMGLITGLTLIFETVKAVITSVGNTLMAITEIVVAFVEGIWEAGKKLLKGGGLKDAGQEVGKSLSKGVEKIKENVVPIDFSKTTAMAMTTDKVAAGIGKIMGTLTSDTKKEDKEKKEKMPEPQSFMKKLPASSWEKMGLVIGGAKNTTNELIKESNKHLSTIAKAIVGGTGIPRSSFGINPTVANP